MKLYLIGGMRGFKDYNYPQFNLYAKIIRDMNHEVFNPSEAFNGDTTLPIEQYAEVDFDCINKWAEGCVLLPNYVYSELGYVEILLAKARGRKLFQLDLSGDTPKLIEVKEINPVELAANTVRKKMREAALEGDKKHSHDSWRIEPINKHIDKSSRHLATAKLIREGNQSEDNENHLENAVCRSVMALAIDLTERNENK